MGDFASPNGDLIPQERLQRRLESYRKHHADNKIHYDNYANADHERIREDTKVLYQKWLDGKSKKAKSKIGKVDANGKDLSQIKPKPKVNTVKPMVINPTVTEHNLDPTCSAPCPKEGTQLAGNLAQRHPPYQNPSNTGSVQVNINLDANLAQAQNSFTVRFSSRITGNGGMATPNECKSSLAGNSIDLTGGDCSGQQPCKVESSDLSLCDPSDTSEFDKFLDSVPIDEDMPIDFDILNNLDGDFFPAIPSSDQLPSSHDSNFGQAAVGGVTMPHQKATFQNQPVQNQPQMPSSFPQRVEFNISGSMSKFTPYLGEAPGPAAETLKHLAAKHVSQEKTQQRMIQTSDMYMKAFSPRECYPIQPAVEGFTGDGQAAVGAQNCRSSYPGPQCQIMGVEGQSPMADGMRHKNPPCYQEAKAMLPQGPQMHVPQPSVHYSNVRQKLNVASSVRDGEVGLEMEYDYEQCRLSQEGGLPNSVPLQGQAAGRAYPNTGQMNPAQVEVYRMQHHKSAAPGYQRYHPYSAQGHQRFVNSVGSPPSVPSGFIHSQVEMMGAYDGASYGMNTSMNMNVRQQQMCMMQQHQQQQLQHQLQQQLHHHHQQQQQQQTCASLRQNSMAMVNPMQPKPATPGAKESAASMTEMIMPVRYPSVGLEPSAMNQQAVQASNPEMFYSDGNMPVYRSYPVMAPMSGQPGIRFCSTSSVSQGLPMTNRGMIQAGYHDAGHHIQQNCYPDGRSYIMAGGQLNQMYPYHHHHQQQNHHQQQQANAYFRQTPDAMRMMQYQGAPDQQAPGLAAGYDPSAKRSPQNGMPGMRMEGFGYSF